MKKKDLALEVIDRLKKCYPESDCTLDYNEAWKLLISVRLAAQCTDERVNKIVPKLYEKFPDIESLANADVAEITEIVKPCGLGNSKASTPCGRCSPCVHATDPACRPAESLLLHIR